MKNVTYLSCVTDSGANIRGSKNGGLKIKEMLINKGTNPSKFREYVSEEKDAEKNIHDIVQSCSQDFKKELNEGKFPILLGGDHSCAMASISAVGNYCKENNRPLFVFWFDAHSDIHTTDTSETGNIHGMPVAMLSGLDTTGRIITPGKYLDLNRFYLLGARSIDKEEKKILRDNHILFAPDFKHCVEIIQHALKSSTEDSYFHISFDVDCLDPSVASGVSTPEVNGFKIEEALELLKMITKDSRFQSMDIVEYNPEYDTADKKTLKEIEKIIELVTQ